MAKSPNEMTFFEHLGDLRKRILYSFVFLLIFFFVAWNFREEIYHWLSLPILRFLEGSLIFTSLTEPIMMYIKLSFIAALFMASPFVFHQLWLFISPGLYKKERRYVFPFVTMATVFFLAGGAFGYYVVFPMYVKFLLGFGQDFTQMIKIKEYFSLILTVLVGLACMFELPVLVFLFAKMGLVTSRFLLRYFKYAVVLIFVIAAVLTPTPDIINQSIFAVPTILLYLLSVLIARIFGPKPVEVEDDESS
jgi:sec-independent protein translocase protein TatC